MASNFCNFLFGLCQKSDEGSNEKIYSSVFSNLSITVFPRFSAPGRLPIFEDFGGALNRTGTLTRARALIKTYDNLDSPFPAHIRTENGLVVPCIYHGRSPSHQVAKTLKNELCKASKLYAHMQIEVPDTPVTKKVWFKN